MVLRLWTFLRPCRIRPRFDGNHGPGIAIPAPGVKERWHQGKICGVNQRARFANVCAARRREFDDTAPMQETLVQSLRTRQPQIRARWEALLRAEPVNTPLAYPDSLVHLIDWTLDEIFRGLVILSTRRRSGKKPAGPDYRPDCPCGRNPLLTYFSAGEQAVREALVLAQAAATPLDPIERDASLEELNLVFQHIARREIEAFCGVCQHREDGKRVTLPASPPACVEVGPVLS